MTDHIFSDHDLIDVFQSGDEDDLGIIADLITDRNRGRISLDSAIRTQIEMLRRTKSLKENCDLLAKEIQDFGGNSIVNFFRGKGVVYREIVNDVAEHMKVKCSKSDSVEQIEMRILLAVAVKAMEKMTVEEQGVFVFDMTGGKFVGFGPGAVAAMQAAILAGGFSSYILATTIAQATAKQLVGRGLSFGATGGLMRGISVFSGPIGWAITAIWAAFDLASPAYRVTVPCVIQVAYMRQKAKGISVPRCDCGNALMPSQKFCPECGKKHED